MLLYFREYLAMYEEDGVLRVLHEEDVHQILDEDEDKIEVGDLVNALWSTGVFYEVKVLMEGRKFLFTIWVECFSSTSSTTFHFCKPACKNFIPLVHGHKSYTLLTIIILILA